MALMEYRRKRDFEKTPEPRGVSKSGGDGAAFVVHKHAARRLHYDLRLEMDGVLKSWAVTRGPSLVAGDKRLAVHVEDHPLDYAGFEGTIPKGQYGGGAVIVWDRGRWAPSGDVKKGYAKGRLEFELSGDKLKGRWHLVRMARKPREKVDNWLLIKASDDFARGQAELEITEERPESVESGLTVEEMAGGARGKPRQHPASARKAAFPGFVPPALATLRPKAPGGTRWLHEIKFDGYRLQAHLREGKVRLYTRSGLDWTGKFGAAIPESLKNLDAATVIIDGEAVVEGPFGASDFSALQAALSEDNTDAITLYCFDLLYLDGIDLRASELVERKKFLGALLTGAGPALRYSEHFEEGGDMVLRHACRLSLEGIVSKGRSSPYVSGRSKHWIKSKCSERQEFVIAGYTRSSVASDAIGSLSLGYYTKDGLFPAGRVGTGFSAVAARDLFSRLKPLARPDSPFDAPLPAEDRRDDTFVAPELVAEVEYRAWTAKGSLRHASFRGLREDKKASDVIREDGARKSVDKPRPPVRLTHPDRIYWPEAGVTKEGLANYYSEVWPRMAWWVANRPLSLLRCPGGIEAQCFFQKHAWRGKSSAILEVVDPHDRKKQRLIAVDDLPGLMGLVQGGVLEIHPWGATVEDIERPDILTMDLDPGPDVHWARVVEAAREVRSRLRDVGLESFVKTSGGKGLHVVASLAPRAEWPRVKAFTRGIAVAMAGDAPESYVATVSKAKRGGRILIDYLRNGRGATAVAPYSTRARKGAPVSMPIGWEELSLPIGPDHFSVPSVRARLDAVGDPWADFRRAARPLPDRG